MMTAETPLSELSILALSLTSHEVRELGNDSAHPKP
jgi:hypothetical protein